MGSMNSKQADMNRFIADIRNVRRGNFYDRVRLEAGVTPRVLEPFTVPLGTGTPLRTFTETNMLSSSFFGLNPPHDIIIDAFLLLFQPSTRVEDRDAFLAACYWEIAVLNRIIWHGPAIFPAAEGEIKAQGPDGLELVLGPLAPDEEEPVRKLGQGFGYSFRAQTALYLSPLIQFSVRLYIPNPPVLTTSLDFYVILDGLRGYPVQ
jgi:hypothetical protein